MHKHNPYSVFYQFQAAFVLALDDEPQEFDEVSICIYTCDSFNFN